MEDGPWKVAVYSIINQHMTEISAVRQAAVCTDARRRKAISAHVFVVIRSRQDDVRTESRFWISKNGGKETRWMYSVALKSWKI